MHRFDSDAEKQAFRSKVRQVAAERAEPADAGRAWCDLMDGRSSVLDSFTTSHCSYLVVTREILHPPVSKRSLHMLVQVLTGSYPKRVAAELDLAQSTIAVLMKEALERVGVGCLPSKVPLALAALLFAARDSGTRPHVFSSTVQLLGVECEILATPMPSLSHLLPPTVEAVLKLHVAGRTHREIAALRGTSCRTIANQLATAFGRIGRSGRLSVLEFLLSSCEERWEFDVAG